MAIRFLTAGESHGPALTVIVEGFPAGLAVDRTAIDRELRRRMGGFGRGGRMQIEADVVEIVGGVRFGATIGSPVALTIRNRGFRELVGGDAHRRSGSERRRCSRGDPSAAGARRPRRRLKYGTHDARDILERASARETAARTAAGALAKALLAAAGIDVTSRTVAVGAAIAPDLENEAAKFDRLLALPDDAPMRCSDPGAVAAMVAAVEDARRSGDSIGGVFEVLARGVPAGFGSHVHWDRRLDGRLGGAVLSIPAVKAVAIGEGVESSGRHGSEVHDAIGYDPERRRFTRPTNRAGGIEGGMSNGETIRVRGWLKPLATLPRPLASVDLVDKAPFEAAVERTDTIPIVAAGVVGEAMVALVLADEFLAKFGGDRLDETLRNLAAYRDSLTRF